jgi:hypothetical protein
MSKGKVAIVAASRSDARAGAEPAVGVDHQPKRWPRVLFLSAALAWFAPTVAALDSNDQGAKVSVVFEHELPNVPGKSMRAVLVEYAPGAGSPAHRHPTSAFIYARVLGEPYAARSMMGPSAHTGSVRLGGAARRSSSKVKARTPANLNRPSCLPSS